MNFSTIFFLCAAYFIVFVSLAGFVWYAISERKQNLQKLSDEGFLD